MNNVTRVNRVVLSLIIVSLLGFSGYCWQLLSQQQKASELSVAAELILNRVNTDTVYLLGREKANDGNVQQRLNQLSSNLDSFVRQVRNDPDSADNPTPNPCCTTSTAICSTWPSFIPWRWRSST